MNILVTGTEGYIWGIIKNDSKTFLWKEANDSEFIEYDLKNGDDIFDKENMRNKMRNCDVVMHFAAYPSRTAVDKVGEEECMRVNHEGAMEVYNMAKELGIRRFVYVSTGNLYCCGDYFFNKKFPLDVTDIPEDLDKVHPYPRSKILTEQWLKEQKDGPQVVVMRINQVEQEWYMIILLRLNRKLLRFLGKPKKWDPWGGTTITRKRLARYFRNSINAEIKDRFIILDVIEPNENYKGSLKAEEVLDGKAGTGPAACGQVQGILSDQAENQWQSHNHRGDRGEKVR